MKLSNFLSNTLRDLAFGWRQLLKNPLSSMTAILMFALGIGVNTANFSIINAFLLSPLPYEEPEQLVHLFRAEDQSDQDRLGFSWPWIDDLSVESDLFSEIGAYTYRQRVLAAEGEEPKQVIECKITPSLFPMLGVSPVLGRGFDDFDARDGNDQVAIIGHQLWQQRFGGHEDVITRRLRLDGKDYDIVGVMPESFNFPFGAVKIWTPAVTNCDCSAAARNVNVIARMADGISIDLATEQAQRLFGHSDEKYFGEESNSTLILMPLRQALLFLFDTLQAMLWLATAANLFVLFIVCSNVSILLVVRLAERREELAVRQAMGAGRGRLIYQLLVEGLLLSLFGAALGLLVAHLSLQATAQTIPEELFRSGDLRLDFSAMLFALLMAVAATMLFALMPALRTTKDLNANLKESVGGTGLKTQKLRRSAIIVQVVSLMALVMGTFTVSRSFESMQQVDTGFNSHNLLSFEIHLPEGQYIKAAEVWGVVDEIRHGLEAMPGVRSAAYMTPLPLNFEAASRRYRVVGDTADSEVKWRSAREHRVSLGYFETMEIEVLRGRAFDSSDNLDVQSVVVISATMARRLWDNDDPIGRLLSIEYAGEEREVRVVGVVEDTSNFLLSEVRQSIIYLPQTQFPRRRNFFVARTLGEPLSAVGGARDLIENIDNSIGISNIRSMKQVVDESLLPWRMASSGMVAVAVLSMILAAIGIYGLTAHTIVTRSREFGVHMAMGARSGDIVKQLLVQTLKTVALGVAIGFGVYLILVQVLDSLIHGVSAVDPITILAASGAVVVTALIACLFPIRRVLKISLSEVLRYE